MFANRPTIQADDLNNNSQDSEIKYEPSLMWKIVKTELITDKLPSPDEFVNSHLVLPYLLNPERNPSFNLEKNPHVHHVAQTLAAEHRIPSFEAIMNMKEKMLEFQRITTSNMKLMRDDKNHKFIKGFVESAGLTVDECIRFTTKLIDAHDNYEKLRERHKNVTGKELYNPILSISEINTLKQVKAFFEEMHHKLLTDQHLLKKIITNQVLLKKREAGDFRREEHIVTKQITEAISQFNKDYESSKKHVIKALKKDWKKAKDKQYKKQQILKEVVGAAAGPLIGPIAEKGVGILSSLLQTAVNSLNKSPSKHLIQVPILGLSLTDAEQKGSELASNSLTELGSDEIATRILNKSFNLEVKLQPKKSGSIESFTKMIDEITDAFYKKIFSEEWIEKAVIEIRTELMQNYKNNSKFVSRSEFIEDMNKALEERINAAVETYDKKLKELKNKIITMDADETQKINSAKVTSQVFALGYTMAGLDEFKDSVTFNRELEDYLSKIKNRAGDEKIIEFVKKSDWAQLSDINSLGFMDEKAINTTLGLNGRLPLFGEKLRRLTPGKTSKEKLIAVNVDKRILTAVALVRIGEIFKQTCGTILQELITPEQAAHAILQIAKQGVEAPKFKEIYNMKFTSDIIASAKVHAADVSATEAKNHLETAKQNYNSNLSEDKNSVAKYEDTIDQFRLALSAPLATDKETIKKLTRQSTKTIGHLKKLKKIAKQAAKLALKAQEKSEQAKQKLEEKQKIKDKTLEQYARATIPELKKVKVAWETNEKNVSLQRNALKKALKEEEKAKILAEHTLSELTYRNRIAFKDIKESWLFTVFSEIPFLSTFNQNPDVKKHLSSLINFEFALKNSLADPAAQSFLKLEALKGSEFCTFLNFRAEIDVKNAEFNKILEKIDVIKTFEIDSLNEYLNAASQMLLSNNYTFEKDKHPINLILGFVVAGNLLTDIQQEVVIQLLNQLLNFKIQKCEFNMDGVPSNVKLQFYNLYSLLHDNLSVSGNQIAELFKQCHSPNELIEKFTEYFKDTELVKYPNIFNEMIANRFENELTHKYHFRSAC